MAEQPARMTIFVDLDGTLIFSDLLVESFLELLKKNVLYVFLLPLWLLRGKANLKYQIASRVSPRVDLLPYNDALLAYLQKQRRLGARLILISASNEKLVQQVGRHLEVFDEVIGSSSTQNLSGHNKLQQIRSLVGEQPFIYAANAHVDLAVWEHASAAVTVNTSRSLTNRVKEVTQLAEDFSNHSSVLRYSLKSMRLHQWLKNSLLFLPLILAQQYANPLLLGQTVLAFISFCLCASSVYVLNDLLDLPNDRQHHSKRNRPFAAGHLPLLVGLGLSPALLLAAFALALLLPVYFVMVLSLYYVVTVLYSFALKKIVLVDVLTLAALYTLRIIAGAAAIMVIPSFWLLAFSMFLFMSLAIAKRYTELCTVRDSGLRQSEGRGYFASDLNILAVFGCTSAFMSVMVFALYINSENLRQQYATPEALWFICPLLLYLVSRIWLVAGRGQLHEDPIVFALQDRISQSVTLAAALLFYLANLDWRTILLT